MQALWQASHSNSFFSKPSSVNSGRTGSKYNHSCQLFVLLRNVALLVTLSILLGSAAFVPTQALAREPVLVNAGCFIKTAEGLVLVKDLWTGRLTPPAGGPEYQERGWETAQRETYEETGITVNVGKLLARFEDRFFLYECEPVGPLLTKGEKRLFLPTHARNEVSEILLVDPCGISVEKWRFPSEREKICELYRTQPVVKVSIESSPVLSPNSVHASELKGIQVFQAWNRYPLWLTFNRWLTSLAEETFILFLIPFLWFFLSPRLGIRISFLVLISAVINGFLKEVAGFPRPFDYFPEYQFHAAGGFGFPSGHAQIAVVVLGLLALKLKNRSFTIFSIIFSILIGLSRIFLGAHFFTDVVGGWSLGLSLILLWSRYGKAIESKLKEDHWRWALVGISFLIAALLTDFDRFMLSKVSLLIGFWIGLMFRFGNFGKALSIPFFDRRVNLIDRFLAFTLAIAGLYGIPIFTRGLFPKEISFHLVLLCLLIEYLMMGFWVSYLCEYVFRKLVLKK